MAHYEDLSVDQGASVRYRLQLLSPDGSIRDLSDFRVRGTINRSQYADSSEATYFRANIDAPPEKGIIDISLSPKETEGLLRRRYIYDVELVIGDSDSEIVERILEGNLLVSRSPRGTGSGTPRIDN